MPELEVRPIFGASVLETLTTGMYTNSLDSIRELVQNAFDSARKARKDGILKQDEPASIEITIDKFNRSLSVRDNGVGVSVGDAAERLTNVGTSKKIMGEDVGFRGIGRLHSVAYCDRLVFRAKAAGEDQETEISLNAKGLREWMRPGNLTNDSASDILYSCSDIRRIPAKARDDHFFEVRLEGVNEAVPELQDFDRLHEYLCENAPVDFTTGFVYATKIRKYALTNHFPLETVPLLLRSGSKERLIYKPYRGTYKPLRDIKDDSKDSDRIEIQDVVFWPDEITSDTRVWGWYSRSELLAQIGDKAVAGFRLRKQNMSVGGVSRVEELIQESRFCRYFVGEIHVLDPGCIPNARRDGFEDTPEWTQVKKSIAAFLKDRERDVRTASKLRANPVGRTIRSVTQTAEKVISDSKSGVTSKSEREQLLETVEKARAKLSEIKESKVAPEVVEDYRTAMALLDQAKEAVEIAEFVVVKTKGQLDRKQKKLLQDVLEVLQKEFSEPDFKRARAAIMSRFEADSD